MMEMSDSHYLQNTKFIRGCRIKAAASFDVKGAAALKRIRNLRIR